MERNGELLFVPRGVVSGIGRLPAYSGYNSVDHTHVQTHRYTLHYTYIYTCEYMCFICILDFVYVYI